MKRIIGITILLLITGYLVWLFYPAGTAMVVSVSPDGRYAITSHQNRHIILWDLVKQEKKTLSRLGNIYSAYFINNDTYMWQQLLTKNVVVTNISGHTQLRFTLPIDTYGHVMSQDLSNYFASDYHWAIYSRNQTDKTITTLKEGFGGMYAGKLLNLSLDDNAHILISAGDTGKSGDYIPLSRGKTRYDAGILTPEDGDNGSLIDGLLIWDAIQKQPLFKLVGNQVKTNATISPDGRFVVGGDESSNVFVWNTKNGKKKLEHYSLLHGKWIPPENRVAEDIYWDNSEMTLFPPDRFTDLSGSYRRAVLALKFIKHSEYYLRFTTYIPYAILYHIDDPKPLAYFPLDGVRPSVDEYLRNSSIATAPHAGVLVTGQSMADGINVYHYNAEARTLELSWSAS